MIGNKWGLPTQGQTSRKLCSYKVNDIAKYTPRRSMAIFSPAFEPWVYSSSCLIEPFAPLVFVFASYVPASCHARRSMMGAQPLEAMSARRSRRAPSTCRRYSASTTGAAMVTGRARGRRRRRRKRGGLAWRQAEETRSGNVEAAEEGGGDDDDDEEE